MPAFVILKPIDPVHARTLSAFKPEGALIGQYGSASIFEAIRDEAGRRYSYLGVVPRDRDGKVVAVGLWSYQRIVPPGLIYEFGADDRCTGCAQLAGWKECSATNHVRAVWPPTTSGAKPRHLLNVAAQILACVGAVVDPIIAERFEYLSANGNSNCSQPFLDSIPAMPENGHLQGSCCGPMKLGRYAKQIRRLKKYKRIAAIPRDPYDIEVGVARHAIANYELALSRVEQMSYDYAMAHAGQHGPCCCRCWRWRVYSGLAKFLIHYHGFVGPQVAEVWNLSDGGYVDT